MLDRSKGRRQTKRDTKTDAGSSVISSGLKHITNYARDSLSSYSNRRDQRGLNGCCTGKAIKEMSNKATGDDVPGDVLKLLGEGGLKILTKPINTIYETGQWSKNFTEVTMTALKKDTNYKMQRPSHNQPYFTYSKDNSKDI